MLVLASVVVVFQVSDGLPELRDGSDPLAKPRLDTLASPRSLAFLALGCIAVPVTWVMLASMLPGQVLGAVFVGSWIAGTVARLCLPTAQPVLVFAGPILLGGIVQLVLASGVGGNLPDALVEGTYPRLLWVMPADWIGGTLAGTAFGLGFAKMFFEGSLANAPSEGRDWGPSGSRA